MKKFRSPSCVIHSHLCHLCHLCQFSFVPCETWELVWVSLILALAARVSAGEDILDMVCCGHKPPLTCI